MVVPAPAKVYATGYGLDVLGIDAVPNSAQVVEVETLWHCAYGRFVHDAMTAMVPLYLRAVVPVPEGLLDSRVAAIVQATLVQPASVVIDNDLVLDARSHRGQVLHENGSSFAR